MGGWAREERARKKLERRKNFARGHTTIVSFGPYESPRRNTADRFVVVIVVERRRLNSIRDTREARNAKTQRR